MAKFKDFQGLENEAIFSKDFQGYGNPGIILSKILKTCNKLDTRSSYVKLHFAASTKHKPTVLNLSTSV